jgi:hypothetical protein
MTPDHAASPHSLVSASGLLLGTLVAAMAGGALVGWALGSWSIGLVVGAIAGLPGGSAAVYLRYRSYFTG